VIDLRRDSSEGERAEQPTPAGDERFRFVFHRSPVGIFQYDTRLHVTECNEQFLAILQAWGKPVENLELHTLKDQRLLPALQAALTDGAGLYEGPYEATSGSGHSWIQLKTVPLHDDHGRVQGAVGIIQDLTERKRVEVSLEKRTCALQALHQVTKDLGSELKVSAVLRRIMDRAVELLDARRGGGIYLYDAAENVLRLAEVSGINEGRTGTVLQMHEGMAGQVFQTGQPLIVNDYANWPGRATVLVPWPSSAVMGVPLFLDERVIGVLGVFDDSHRRTFDQSDVELAEMFAAQAAIAIRNADLYEQAQREIAERKRAEEAVLRAHDELERRVEVRTKEWDLANAQLAWQIEERERAEAALRESEAVSGSILASLVGHLAIVDRSGVIVRVNDAWDRFARENDSQSSAAVSVGADYLDVCRRSAERGDEIAQAALEGIEAVLAGRRGEFVLEYPCHAPSKERWFEMRVSSLKRPEGGAAIFHADVSYRKQAELEMGRLRRELAHMSRVSMMGELTASLAHELNQPLTAIVSNAHAGERYLAAPAPPLAEVGEILADVAADAQRAGEVIRRMRSLLKNDTTRFLPLELNEVIREVVALTQTDALIRHHPIALALAPALPPVRGDRVQLQQVLLNLVLNGMEAMEAQAPAARHLGIQTLRAGPAVRVGVQDRGPGLPPERLETVFDAFFTTKASGMGMGLAISRSIVEAHGGRIWAENNPDRGATFWFSLPL
jgi:PAS domain S-box-containing protein